MLSPKSGEDVQKKRSADVGSDHYQIAGEFKIKRACEKANIRTKIRYTISKSFPVDKENIYFET